VPVSLAEPFADPTGIGSTFGAGCCFLSFFFDSFLGFIAIDQG
jgi:hypothetical protein